MCRQTSWGDNGECGKMVWLVPGVDMMTIHMFLSHNGDVLVLS